MTFNLFEEKEYPCCSKNNANNSLMGFNKIMWFLNSKKRKRKLKVQCEKKIFAVYTSNREVTSTR